MVYETGLKFSAHGKFRDSVAYADAFRSKRIPVWIRAAVHHGPSTLGGAGGSLFVQGAQLDFGRLE